VTGIPTNRAIAGQQPLLDDQRLEHGRLHARHQGERRRARHIARRISRFRVHLRVGLMGASAYFERGDRGDIAQSTRSHCSYEASCPRSTDYPEQSQKCGRRTKGRACATCTLHRLDPHDRACQPQPRRGIVRRCGNDPPEGFHAGAEIVPGESRIGIAAQAVGVAVRNIEILIEPTGAPPGLLNT
jgi:hypothetical protein